MVNRGCCVGCVALAEAEGGAAGCYDCFHATKQRREELGVVSHRLSSQHARRAQGCRQALQQQLELAIDLLRQLAGRRDDERTARSSGETRRRACALGWPWEAWRAAHLGPAWSLCGHCSRAADERIIEVTVGSRNAKVLPAPVAATPIKSVPGVAPAIPQHMAWMGVGALNAGMSPVSSLGLHAVRIARATGNLAGGLGQPLHENCRPNTRRSPAGSDLLL